MVGRIIIGCLLFCLNVAGQEQNTVDSVCHQDSTHTLMARLRQVQQILDARVKKKVDPAYIEVPEKPWRVIMRYKENVVDVDYFQGVDLPESNEHSDVRLCFEPPLAASVGVWVGYRGLGASISRSVARNAGRYYSISSTGAKFGFNFRLRRFRVEKARFMATDYKDGKLDGEPYDTVTNMYSPVWIRSVYVNGYYVLNGRHYSQAAAYNQSVIQRRSSGSLLLGLTWYQSSFDYSDINNYLYMLISDGIRRIKVHQANLGIGYGYNWVPLRGLVVNAMAMPTFSVYNRVKVYRYNFNYCLAEDDPVDDYGEWNRQTKTWANGKMSKPILMDEDLDLDYWDGGAETAYSAFQLNLDLRVGIAYNWKNYFVGLQGQYNNFIYKKDKTKVNLYDAYARLSFGVRL